MLSMNIEGGKAGNNTARAWVLLVLASALSFKRQAQTSWLLLWIAGDLPAQSYYRGYGTAEWQTHTVVLGGITSLHKKAGAI